MKLATLCRAVYEVLVSGFRVARFPGPFATTLVHRELQRRMQDRN